MCDFGALSSRQVIRIKEAQDPDLIPPPTSDGFSASFWLREVNPYEGKIFALSEESHFLQIAAGCIGNKYWSDQTLLSKSFHAGCVSR